MDTKVTQKMIMQNKKQHFFLFLLVRLLWQNLSIDSKGTFGNENPWLLQ